MTDNGEFKKYLGSEFTDSYVSQISYEMCGFTDEVGKNRRAYMFLKIPIEMLTSYLRITRPEKKFPLSTSFWKDTRLLFHLQEKSREHKNKTLEDFLFRFTGKIELLHTLTPDKKYVKFMVYEQKENIISQ